MRQRVYETAGANTYRVPENDMSICMKLYLMAIMLLCVHRSVPKQKNCWEIEKPSQRNESHEQHSLAFRIQKDF